MLRLSKTPQVRINENDQLQEQIRQAINETQIESEAKGEQFFDAFANKELSNGWIFGSNNQLNELQILQEVQNFCDKEDTALR